ncbi:helix-turn-helix domain-containing protein [Anaeromyxobacter sp. PSR-1]|uniref:helix-turn-helix domain-containing protein n=1 Tax=Anaeromyxobacter sp. PSR-1 TaxID=1300915 RepID=UPI0009E37BF5|nr:helix-turn-helix transcriptional regulator [Anaeromyxobacter sp. PSR-1]
MADDRKTLGTRLKEAREYLGLSQEEVSKAVGLTRSAISLLESGQRKVDALELGRFAVLYQRPVSDFTGETVPDRAPASVAHLARAAAKLSEQDREELIRFAEFLGARSVQGKGQ